MLVLRKKLNVVEVTTVAGAVALGCGLAVVSWVVGVEDLPWYVDVWNYAKGLF